MKTPAVEEPSCFVPGFVRGTILVKCPEQINTLSQLGCCPGKASAGTDVLREGMKLQLRILKHPNETQ